MKVEFLKNHMKHKSGSKADVSQEQGVYFIRVGVAKEVTEKPKKAKETKELKQDLETK